VTSSAVEDHENPEEEPIITVLILSHSLPSHALLLIYCPLPSSVADWSKPSVRLLLVFDYFYFLLFFPLSFWLFVVFLKEKYFNS
jgi:hypothetical protein